MRQPAFVFRLAALMLLLPCNIAMAQSYLYATGNPTFGVNIPVENGFINITNGNLHMEFHLATMKQRGALTLDEKLVYDSRIWLIGCYSNCYWWPTNVPNTPYTQDGWRFVKGNETGSLSYTEIYSTSNTCWLPGGDTGTDDIYTFNVVWADPSGTTHTFSAAATEEDNSCTNTTTQTVNSGTAIDASGYSIQDDGTGNPEILDNNGTEVYPQVIDRYGNYFSSDANGNLVDSLGRTPVIVTTSGNVTYYDVLAPNGPINNQGTRVRYTVTTAPIAVSTKFNLSGVTEWQGSLNPIQSIQLPDGSSYTFTYEKVYGNVVAGYGELQSVTLPTGGVINYGYANYIESYSTLNRWLTSRTVGSNPAMTLTPAVVTFCSQNGTGCQENITLHQPSGDETVYNLTLNNGAWDTTETHYNGPASNDTALISVANTYDFSHPCQSQVCSGADYITKSNTVTTLLDASLSTQTQYAYNLNIGKLASIKQWDYYPSSNTPSGTPTRETDYSYAGYDLAQTTQLDSSGNPAAQTTYGYTTSASTTSGVTQHGTANAGGPYLQTISQWLDTGGDKLTTTYAMDDTGMVKSVTDPKSDPPTTATYQCSNALPYQVTNALGQMTTYSYDCNSGAILSIKDPNDAAAGRAGTVYQYESAGRVQSISYPDGGQTSYSYPSATEVDTSVLATPDPTITSQTILDPFGRLYQQVSAGVSKETTYDANGRVSCVTNPHLSSTSSTDGTACITTYDGLNRPTLETEQDGNPLRWSYHGNTVTSTDEMDSSWQRTSDAFGELTNVIEPGNLQTGYIYDALGNLKTIAQNGTSGDIARNRSFTYDWLSRMQSATTPEAGTVTYSYLTNGSPCSGDPTLPCFTSDARGITTNFSYDTLNRLTNKQSSGGSGIPGFNYTFGYDSVNPPEQNGIGRLLWTTNGTGEAEQYFYDPMGRMISQAWYLPSAPSTPQWTSATYDLAGNTTGLTYPDGRVVDQTFNSLGQMLTSTFDNYNGQHVGYSYVTGITYTPVGAQAEIYLGNIAYVHTPYNNRGQMCQVWANGSRGFIDTHIYYGGEIFCSSTPGDNGNIIEVKDWKDPGLTRSFLYDNLNRITSFSTADKSMQQSYTYDSFGNLKNQSGTLNSALTIGSNNQVTNNGFLYDAAGNATQMNNGLGNQTYSYDAENKLVTVNGNAAAYTYDAANNRVRKDLGGDWREYVYFNGQPLAEKNSDGSWSDYIYANGQRIARADNYDVRIHFTGTNCSNCGPQAWAYDIPVPTGYMVQSGDSISWRQYQQGSAVPRGGLALAFSDGTYTNWVAVDQNQQVMNDLTTQNAWVYRSVDLSQYAGKTIVGGWINEDTKSGAGDWQEWFSDIAYFRADGTVQTIFDRQSNVSYPSFGSSGVTNQTFEINVMQNDAWEPLDTTTYYLGDQIDSTRMTLAAGGWPMSSDIFYPFGQEQTASTDPNHYKFAMLERDSESGLDHATFRQYTSTAGRWMSPDPYNGSYDLKTPQSFNRYGYVGNNPLAFSDPTGQDACSAAVGEAAAFGPVGGVIGGLSCAAELFGINKLLQSLFGLGRTHYYGSRASRADNHQIWDEHGGFHVSPYSSITSMIGDVDGWYPSGCEFGGGCGSGGFDFTEPGQTGQDNNQVYYQRNPWIILLPQSRHAQGRPPRPPTKRPMPRPVSEPAPNPVEPGVPGEDYPAWKYIFLKTLQWMHEVGLDNSVDPIIIVTPARPILPGPCPPGHTTSGGGCRV